MNLNIKRCARCGEDHSDIEAKRFTNPIEISEVIFYTHWFMCPKLDEPVIVTIVDDTV